MVPLSPNNVPRLFLTLKGNNTNWQIASIGNRKLTTVFRDPKNPARDELLSVTGLEIDFLRKGADSSATLYIPLENNLKAGFVKDSAYTPEVTFRKLKEYATYLSREFGDKLKTGEIDR